MRTDTYARCSICGSPLDVPGRPWSENCGGDCVVCMADADDPECVEAVAAMRAGESLVAAFDAVWRNVIAYPMPQVRKHLIASNILSDMERLGFAVTPEVADAVVNARDEEALAHPRIVFHQAAINAALAERPDPSGRF